MEFKCLGRRVFLCIRDNAKDMRESILICVNQVHLK